MLTAGFALCVQGGRDMTYFDLPDLKFMTQCIMETLRLW